jgi:hypothetical protein
MDDLLGTHKVLRDLLAPNTPIPHVRLTQIFRQASHSGVVTNAHRVNAGDYPRTQDLGDFFISTSRMPSRPLRSPWMWWPGGSRPSLT